TGFNAYKSSTKNDSNSIFADPRFLNAAMSDFHLPTNSPALNSGAPAFEPIPGETDIDGEPRVAGGRVDLGADEVLPSVRNRPKLQSFVPSGSGQIQIRLIGDPNGIYQLDSTPDWSIWSPRYTNSTPDGSWTW